MAGRHHRNAPAAGRLAGRGGGVDSPAPSEDFLLLLRLPGSADLGRHRMARQGARQGAAVCCREALGTRRRDSAESIRR
eukprot:scaffold48770_cov13-Prasinocladus_malaysianus.AAC.1